VIFADLLAHPGVEEVVEVRSRFGFMAFHGGSLEAHTDTVAVAAAEACGASVYAVRQPDDLRWHVPSTAVAPDASDGLRRFLEHVEVVVTVHGYGRAGRWTHLLLGGRNRPLARHVASHLRPALPGFEVVDALPNIPRGLRGLDRRNPVNLPVEAGVQLELPPRVRRDEHRHAVTSALATAAATWRHSASPRRRSAQRRPVG
jgi:phage replication-related protein YjqB (UPF0714/DUF867 family)